MIIVDTALEKRAAGGNPVKVAMTGAGYMGRGIALQIEQYLPGMQLVAISNRSIEKARLAYEEAGVEKINHVESAAPDARRRVGRRCIHLVRPARTRLQPGR